MEFVNMEKSRKYGFAFVVAAILLTASATLVTAGKNKGFVHGIMINVDGEDYYLEGAPDADGGAFDIPGHYWVIAGPNKLIGKHYNTGPFGMENGWSSDAPDGELLYIVDGIIDNWSEEKAMSYASKGYVHYHELRKVSDGTHHLSKVIWFKHTARTSFTLDGGPEAWGGGDPSYEHYVMSGVDYLFPNNYMNPYIP
jgi:selenium-binding protein 1